MQTTPCPVAQSTAAHQRQIDAAATRDEFIADRTEQHAESLLNDGFCSFDTGSFGGAWATIEADVEPLLVDVISQHDFDELCGQLLFAMCRQQKAEKCAPEQVNADITLLKQFVDIGMKAINNAAKEIAEKEWKVLHGN